MMSPEYCASRCTGVASALANGVATAARMGVIFKESILLLRREPVKRTEDRCEKVDLRL